MPPMHGSACRWWVVKRSIEASGEKVVEGTPDRDIECIWGEETELAQGGVGDRPSENKGHVRAGSVRKTLCF
jgi:hypothetical protein